MKVGDYVRTPYGIRKVKEIRIKDNYLDDGFYVEDKFIICGHKTMQEIKSSPNIIDLIEVGDYVNGSKVVRIEKHNEELYVYVQETEYCNACDEEENIYYKEDTIKSILTKEQFESMEYKIC